MRIEKKVAMTMTHFDPNRSIATLTVAELEKFVQATIQAYTSHLVPPTSELNTPFDSSVQSIGAIAAEHASQIPDEVWQTVPENASENVDKYLYEA